MVYTNFDFSRFGFSISSKHVNVVQIICFSEVKLTHVVVEVVLLDRKVITGRKALSFLLDCIFYFCSKIDFKACHIWWNLECDYCLLVI
jgi:hypothetical protein